MPPPAEGQRLVSWLVQSGEIVLLVGNPASRSGRGAARIDLARTLLDQAGLAHEFRSTLPEGGTCELVAKAILEEGFRTVVVLGGDGTFNEVAKGVCRSGVAHDVRLGLLPAGTANDQGKSFGISSSPRALEKNIRVIANGLTTDLDVGEVEALSDSGVVMRRDLFFDSIGWGLSAAILAFRNRELGIVKKVPIVRDMYRDQMVYVRAAVHALALSWVTNDRFAAEITIDGTSYMLDRLSDLVVNNTKIYAGEWIVDETSLHDDGQLEIAPFNGIRDWTSKLLVQHKKIPLTESMLNKIGVSHSPVYRGRDIQIRLFHPHKTKSIPAQLDGEEFVHANHFIIRVHPRHLRLIVPENFHWI